MARNDALGQLADGETLQPLQKSFTSMVDRFALPFLFPGCGLLPPDGLRGAGFAGLQQRKTSADADLRAARLCVGGHQQGELDASAWIVGSRALPA